MSEWIDYNMIMNEIGLHRSNAQFRIKEYRDIKNKRKLTKEEIMDYSHAVGEETILMCLQQWCTDFKFSTEDLKKFDEFK